MSDEAREATEGGEAYFDQLGTGLVLPYHYPIVDAALRVFLREYIPHNNYPIRTRRSTLTTGSNRYTLTVTMADTAVELGQFVLQMVKPDHTLTIVSPAPANPDQAGARDILTHFLYKFSTWLEQEQMRIDEILPAQQVSNVVPPSAVDAALKRQTVRPVPQPRGAPPAEVNEWARDQVKQGVPRDKVFAEFLQRSKDLNPTNAEHVKLGRERFRKALAYTTQSKRGGRK